jgi:hypothetical protein
MHRKFVFYWLYLGFDSILFLTILSIKECMCIEVRPYICENSWCGNVNSYWWFVLYYLHKSSWCCSSFPTQCLGVYIGYPVPGGNKYMNLTLHVGKSQNGDSKIWSWAPWDSDLRNTVLVRPNNNCKLKTWSLTIIKKKRTIGVGSRWVPDTKIDWPTDHWS